MRGVSRVRRASASPPGERVSAQRAPAAVLPALSSLPPPARLACPVGERVARPAGHSRCLAGACPPAWHLEWRGGSLSAGGESTRIIQVIITARLASCKRQARLRQGRGRPGALPTGRRVFITDCSCPPTVSQDGRLPGPMGRQSESLCPGQPLSTVEPEA